MTLTQVVLVGLGGAVGAPLRYVVNHEMRLRLGATAPAGTLVVNVVGSFVLGLLVGSGVTGIPLALLGVGFCGALTTFSTLALELWDAIEDDRTVEAVSLVVLSLALGLGAAALGFTLGS